VADEVLTVPEAAARLKVPPSWLKAQARRGTVRSEKWGHYRRFLWSELLADLHRLTKAADGTIQRV
jgi:hypothetical protein